MGALLSDQRHDIGEQGWADVGANTTGFAPGTTAFGAGRIACAPGMMGGKIPFDTGEAHNTTGNNATRFVGN